MWGDFGQRTRLLVACPIQAGVVCCMRHLRRHVDVRDIMPLEHRIKVEARGVEARVLLTRGMPRGEGGGRREKAMEEGGARA